MAEIQKNSVGTEKKKGGKIIPALCSTLGTIILVALILGALPLAIPRMLGYEIYTVVSESMEPTIPLGSLVYAKREDPKEMLPGDIVVFYRSGMEVTHRVVENDVEEEELITKGDANDQEDIMPVAYRDFIGRVKRHVPFDSRLLILYGTQDGKISLLCYAVSGLLLNLIGARLRKKTERDEDERKRSN